MEKTVSVKEMTFETALSELELIVRSLEKGDTPLEDSIAAYERGMALKSHCENKLREAQAKIETISINKNGAVETAPFATQE